MSELATLVQNLDVIVFNDGSGLEVRATLASLMVDRYSYRSVVCVSAYELADLPPRVEGRFLPRGADYFAIFDVARDLIASPRWESLLVLRAGTTVLTDGLTRVLRQSRGRREPTLEWQAAPDTVGLASRALALEGPHGYLLLPLDVEALLIQRAHSRREIDWRLQASLSFRCWWEWLVRLRDALEVRKVPEPIVARTVPRDGNPIDRYYDHLERAGELTRDLLPPSTLEWARLDLTLHGEIVRAHPSFFESKQATLATHLHHDLVTARQLVHDEVGGSVLNQVPLGRRPGEPGVRDATAGESSPSERTRVNRGRSAKLVRPMSILLLSTHSPFHELSGGLAAGAEIAMRTISEQLVRRGHRVHYLTLGDQREDARLNGVDVHLRPRAEASRLTEPSFSVDRLASTAKTVVDHGSRLTDFVGSAAGSRRRSRVWEAVDEMAVALRYQQWGLRVVVDEIVTNYGVQLIHSFSSLPDALAAALVSRRRSVPLVLRMGGRYWFLRYSTLDGEARRSRYRRELQYVFKSSACLAFNSHSLLIETERMFDKLGLERAPDQRVVDIGVAATGAAFGEHQALAAFSRHGDGRCVRAVAVGKFKANSKRQDLIVDAVASIVPDVPVKLFLIGDGPTRAQVASRVVERNIEDHVVFLGTVPHDVVFDLLRQADMFVHATEFEGSSKAVAEAMMCACPVVASDIAAIREHVTHMRTGLVVANTADAFAAGIARLATDRRLSIELAARGAAYAAETFDASKNVEAYEDLFSVLVSRGS